MRITKSRLMRGPTINPNPPICKSKEPSFTYIRIFSCADDHLIYELAEYNLNGTQAREAANGGNGTYTKGYFYEAAFKKTTILDQKHCAANNFVQLIVNQTEYGTTWNLAWIGKLADSSVWGFTGVNEELAREDILPEDQWKIEISNTYQDGWGFWYLTFAVTVAYSHIPSWEIDLDPSATPVPMPSCTGTICQTLTPLESWPIIQ